jgi:hypothetical protein
MGDQRIACAYAHADEPVTTGAVGNRRQRRRYLDAKRFGLEVNAHAAAVRIARGRHIDKPGRVVAAERNQMP